MASAETKSNAPRARKRVEVDSTALKRARDGSAFTKCEACNKDVAVGLIDMHNCSLDSKIKMSLEAQVVDKVAEVKASTVEKKRAACIDEKPKRGKKEEEKDPNMPKRPPTAFFLFMDDFRKEYKEAHPDSKSVKEAAKAGGERWKSLTDQEKKPYLDKAAELKAEYEQAVRERSVANEAGNRI